MPIAYLNKPEGLKEVQSAREDHMTDDKSVVVLLVSVTQKNKSLTSYWLKIGSIRLMQMIEMTYLVKRGLTVHIWLQCSHY